VALGVLAPIGVLIVSASMLLDLRRDAWDKAEQTSRNLMQVIERDIARNVEIIDLSLRAVVDNLRAPETAEASPKARQMILFDRAASARDLGVMLVLDGNGDSSLVITQNQYAACVAARSDVITAQTQLQTTEALSIAVELSRATLTTNK
jgi:hypothetical protein